MKTINPFILIILFLHAFHNVGAVVEVNNKNGYVGVVVGISRRVEMDENLIQKLQDLLIATSNFLFQATGQRLYIQEVLIVVPPTKSWESAGYDRIMGNWFNSANIRVDGQNPVYGDTPYTLYSGDCGKQGRYIHITPDFILNKGSFNGKPEKKMVQQWAKYRFGVFEEGSEPRDERFPKLYKDPVFLRLKDYAFVPTSCTTDIEGWTIQPSTCTLDKNNKFTPSCAFEMDETHPMNSSLMCSDFLDQADTFCGLNNRRHNYRAPNRHNLLCNRKSTWDVMKEHNDLKNIRPIPVQPGEPTFRIVQAGATMRVVLVLDVSYSMNDLSRMELMRSSAKRFIRDIIQDGTELGIVQFSGFATTLLHLTKIDSSTRNKTIDSLPKEGSGYTSIGSGITEALKVLKANTEGALIILITDGEENTDPKIPAVIQRVIEAKVVINAIDLGGKSDKNLETLSVKTGGNSFLVLDDESGVSSNMDDALFYGSKTAQGDIDFGLVELSKEDMTLSESETKHLTTYIDSSLGNNTKFTFRSKYLTNLEISLESPNNKIFTQDGTEWTKLDETTGQFLLTEAEAGEWKAKCSSKSSSSIKVSFQVTSEPTDPEDDPVRVEAFISDSTFDTFTKDMQNYALISARVYKGNINIAHATLNATIIRPNGADPLYNFILLYTGSNGLYERDFMDFTGNGRYAVEVKVINDGKATLELNDKSQNSFPPKGNQFKRNKDSSELDKFQRSTNAGSFQVKNFNKDVFKYFPPGQVTDLQIIQSQMVSGIYIIGLQWTAPDDNCFEKPGCNAEVRYSEEMDDILLNFEKGKVFNKTNLAVGSLECKPPGEVQKVVFYLPPSEIPLKKSQTTLYFGVRVENRNQVKGEVSNWAYTEVDNTV